MNTNILKYILLVTLLTSLSCGKTPEQPVNKKVKPKNNIAILYINPNQTKYYYIKWSRLRGIDDLFVYSLKQNISLKINTRKKKFNSVIETAKKKYLLVEAGTSVYHEGFILDSESDKFIYNLPIYGNFQDFWLTPSSFVYSQVSRGYHEGKFHSAYKSLGISIVNLKTKKEQIIKAATANTFYEIVGIKNNSFYYLKNNNKYKSKKYYRYINGRSYRVSYKKITKLFPKSWILEYYKKHDSHNQ